MVAKAAGVAQSTVSLVINNSPRVSDETRIRVLRAARELGYILEPQNKRLLIGVVISRNQPIKSWQAMILSALKEEIYKRSYRMEIICSDDIPLLNDRLVSGAISITTDPKLNDAWSRLKNLSLVRLNGPHSNLDNIYSVSQDVKHDLREMMRPLLEAGHTRIGLFLQKTFEHEQNEDPPHSNVFREIMAERGERHPEELISFADNRDVHLRLMELLSKGVTALIVIPCDIVFNVCRELYLMKLNVPKDISLVTLEYKDICENWTPALTALLRDYPKMCAEALNLLERTLKPDGTVKNILIPGRIIERESVAPPPGSRKK